MGTDVELGQIGNTKTWPVCSSEYSLAFEWFRGRVSDCPVASNRVVLLC